jgi:hypothetical protein
LEFLPSEEEQPRASASRRLRTVTPRVSIVKIDIRFTDRMPNATVTQRTLQTFPAVQTVRLTTIVEIVGSRRESNLLISPHGWSPERRRIHEAFDEGLPDLAIESLRWKVELDRKSRDEVRGRTIAHPEPKGVIFDHFLPARLSARVDIHREILSDVLEVITSPTLRSSRSSELSEYPIDLDLLTAIEKFAHPTPEGLTAQSKNNALNLEELVEKLRAFPTGIRQGWQRRIRLSRARIIDEFSERLRPDLRAYYLTSVELPSEPRRGLEVVRRELEQVKYIGPLRVQPLPLYPVATTLGAADVGPSGEWTASVLDAFKDTQVTYVRPHSIPIEPGNITLETKVLGDAVDEWLAFLGVSSSARTVDRGSLGHELTVSTNQQERQLPLTHVGVGVSQCLPVVVALLLAPQGSVMLLEQPELHLHPAVQSRLADFLLAMALAGRQCIVETHSEHIVNRLRRRIAEDGSDSLSESVALYFAVLQNGQTSYESIKINKFGSIVNWPLGFFDQAQDESEKVLLAAARKRKGRS